MEAGTPAQSRWAVGGSNVKQWQVVSQSPKSPPVNQGNGSYYQQNQFKHEQLIGK